MRLKLFDSKRPFDVRKWPGYYGWTILVVGTIGMIAAVPGSPPGMSVFVDEMISSLELERGNFAIAYTLGTLLAGLCAPLAGRLVDQIGARPMGCLSFFGLGLSLIATGLLDRIYVGLSSYFGGAPLALALVFFAFFGMRLMGLSFAMTTCRSMVFRWFEGRRGIAAAINGTMISLSFSSAPLLLNGFVISIGWQQTWIIVGSVFAFGMTTLAYLFFRDSPEDCGVPVDPVKAESRAEIRTPALRDFSSSEAIRTRTFWIFVAGLALNGLIGTGISFHIVGLAASHELDRQTAVDVFLPAVIFQVATTFLLGAYTERIKLKYMLAMMVFAQGLTLLGALSFSDLGWRWCYIVGSGISWGAFSVLINVPWGRFFGRKHLGAINGWVTGATVVTSALGPLVFGVSYEVTKGYTTAILLCIVFCPIVFALSWIANNPQEAISPSKERT